MTPPKSSFRKWLKVAHLTSAGLWIGGTAALTVLICLYHPDTSKAVEVQNTLLMLLDFAIIAPGALGCLATGILYAWKTPYGFFRFKWVITKWVLNLSFICIGGLVVVPWLEEAIVQSATMTDVTAETAAMMGMHLFINVGQWSVILFLMIISVFKPWGKTRFDF